MRTYKRLFMMIWYMYHVWHRSPVTGFDFKEVNGKRLYQGRIQDWQDRSGDGINGGIDKINPLVKVQAETLERWTYVDDMKRLGVKDHWGTYMDILGWEKLEGDCDDEAAWKEGRLIEMGASTDQVFLVLCPGHMFCGFRFNTWDKDFWVLDNGYLSRNVIEASKLFPLISDGDVVVPQHAFSRDRVWKVKTLRS